LDPPGDLRGMDCGSAREAISAALDGELQTSEARQLDGHLQRCPGCRRWREDAYEMTRRMRLSVVTDAPAPDPGLVAAATAARYERRGSRPPWLARAGLVALALGQIAITVPALVFGTDHDAPIHVAHEMGSFDLAIAAGFLVAAWRPQRAKGMRTLVGVAALLLLVTAVIDLAAGRTTWLDEAPHLLTIAGWLLLEVLCRRAPDEREYPGLAVAGRPTRAAALRPTADPDLHGAAVEEILEPPGRIARRAAHG
jgi:predicted anti-sigma-YlaC factor YlaD